MTTPKSDFIKIKLKLSKKQAQTKKKLHQNFPHLKAILKTKAVEIENLREKSAKLVSLGALTAAVFLTPPADTQGFPIPKEIVDKLKQKKSDGPQTTPQSFLADVFQELLPQRPRPLTHDEEIYLEGIINRTTGLDARTTFENQHLNTTYGFIGYEQHLKRYPGDQLANHGLQTAGIAPGLGAWGHFAPSKQALTPELENIERWYAVVQTMYLPNWNQDFSHLRDWYKYRKVLIVNTQNGNAVVASIADAGPAAWTGKSFGGSPEVMNALGGSKYKKGPVVILFINDPENKIPLGPFIYQTDPVSTLVLNKIYE